MRIKGLVIKIGAGMEEGFQASEYCHIHVSHVQGICFTQTESELFHNF